MLIKVSSNSYTKVSRVGRMKIISAKSVGFQGNADHRDSQPVAWRSFWECTKRCWMLEERD